MAYETGREKEIADIISDELDDPRITWAAIDAAAKRIVAGESALMAALKQFSELGIGSGPDDQQSFYKIEYGAIRAARAALSQMKGKQG